MRVVLLFTLALGACAPEVDTPDVPTAPTTVNPAPGLEAPAAPVPSVEDPTSPQAAVDVVLAYYGALAESDLRRAYEMWGPEGPPDQSFEAFGQEYAELSNIRASVEEPSAPEGAAGSTFITVPVNVTARAADGTDQRFEGDTVVRRVNDVPGAEPWQLRWHIESADLRAVE